MFRLNCNGKILDLSVPAIMGILNVTPDSFHDGGMYLSTSAQLRRVEQMLDEGAKLIDIGAVSTRPGSGELTQAHELERLLTPLKSIRHSFPSAIISVDTYRAGIAKAAVENGADMINDIYAGRYGDGMMETVALLKVPYIMMHMKGDPWNMQDDPRYSDPVAEIAYFFEKQVEAARMKGIKGIIIDPGFGFGKTAEHNYMLLQGLDKFRAIGVPVMAGISRKAMVYKVLGTDPAHALNGTSVLHTVALMKGANLLRVHDAREAAEAISLLEKLKLYSTE